MTTEQKPVPQPNRDSAPFWDGCREHVLLSQQCEVCGRWRWPPNAYCPGCHSRSGVWRRLSGEGEVGAFVVQQRTFNPAFADMTPLVLAHVVLDGTDGRVVMAGNVVGIDRANVAVGTRVTADFAPRGDACVVPQFRPLNNPTDR